MAIDYSKTKIYKLVGGDITYFDSTTSKLCSRLARHKDAPTNNVIQEIISKPDCKIIHVEDFTCIRKDQAKARVQFYIDNNECANKRAETLGNTEEQNIAGRLWRLNNKEKLTEYRKQYKEKHPHKYNPDGTWKRQTQS